MKVSNLIVLAACSCRFVAGTNDAATSVDGFADQDVAPSVFGDSISSNVNALEVAGATMTLVGEKTGDAQENPILIKAKVPVFRSAFMNPNKSAIKTLYKSHRLRGLQLHRNILSASDFSFVGTGWCRDSSNRNYAYIVGNELPAATEAGYCLDWCSQVSHPKLVGMTFDAQNLRCYCMYEGPAPEEIELSSYTPIAYAKGGPSTAVGPVRHSNLDAIMRCYKNDSYGASAPSPSDIGAPSTQPSASLIPSWSTGPSHFPTMNPSSPPSESLPPSDTPLTTSDFSYFGQGYCHSASNRPYNYIKGNEIPIADVDFTDCIDWCLQNARPELVGMNMYRDSSVAICYCLFDVYPVPVSPSDYSPAAHQAGGPQPDIMGPIQMTNSNESVLCYSNNRYSATGSTSSDRPSSSPSTTPSSMPSENPSRDPSQSPSSSPSASPSETPSARVPTSAPSISNSPSLSSIPSSSPTSTASETPSVSFKTSITSSNHPSSYPSSLPSLQPSLAPTLQSSSVPSLSTNPSSSPSISISPSVSNSPSWAERPSNAPSAMPSVNPTLQPSLAPSSSPSETPSEMPSFIHPSFAPSTSNSPSLSILPSLYPTVSGSAAPSISSEPTVTLSDSPSFEPSVSRNPSSSPSISFLPSSSPSSKPTSKCKSDFRSANNWARQNYIVADYRISSDSGEAVLNGELLQKDCTSPITGTTITVRREKSDFGMSGGKHIDFFRFMYDLDQSTIRDSVVFNERTSQIEMCHIVTLGCGSKKNKRIMRIPVRRSRFGSLFGDPHITTFDGLQYDCQAAGEFTTLTSLQDPTFKIQERFTAVGSTCGQASVSTGVAFVDTGKPILQVSIRRSGGALDVVNDCPVDFYVDGNSNSITTDLSSSNVEVIVESDRVRLKHTDTTLALDVIVRRSNSFGCYIMVQITLPGSFHDGETLLGLMGTPNDNKNDDWRAPDGTELPPPATDADSLFSTAYSYCVENWCINDATDSLFSYETGESFEDISGCAVPFSNEVEVAVNNLLDDPSSNQVLSDACGGSLVCLVDGVCGDISDAVSALESEQEIATTQEEAATSVFPLEQTEVTDVDEVTIDGDLEVTSGTRQGGTGTETETEDIYWYPAWDKGSSESVCLNDGEASAYMKMTGLFLETSLEACCERFFKWDKIKCMGDAAITPAGYYPNWGFPESKCLNSITQIGEENSLPSYMVNNPHAWLYNDIESCCKKYYYWDLNSCIVESGGVSSIEFSNKWYVNQDEEICQQDCQEDVSVPTCGGPVESLNALYETASLCCAHKLSWVPPALCTQQSLMQPVTGSGDWFVDWVLLKCVKDCESGESCGGFAKVYDMLYDDADMCCSKLFWKARSECI